MDIALVTGADAGPGLAIARRLIGMGCRVYALATQFARNPFPHDDFIPITCDLADPAAVTKAAEDVLAREGHVTFVVHAARRAASPLLDASVEDLVARVHIGLLAPLALVRVTLPWLRKNQGHFIALCWSGDGPAPGGPVTAAIEGGLHHFTDELFDEMRADGVRATTVYGRPNPDTTPDAALSLDPQSAINPELLADAIESLLRSRPSNVFTTLVIRPASNSETPRIARSNELAGLITRDVQLPPRQNFPSEPELIQTPPRARPADAPPPSEDDFDEDEEDDDWDSGFEPASETPDRDAPYREPREGEGPPPQQRPRPDSNQGYQDRGPGPGRGQGGQGQGRGRRRGRGGRGRGRGRFEGDQRDYPPNRQQGGPPPRGGDAQPSSRPPISQPRDEYPDSEEEAEKRAFARDDSFRTPHSDADEESSGDESPNRPEMEQDEGTPLREESSREDDYVPSDSAAREARHENESRGDGDRPNEPRQQQGQPSQQNRPQGGHGPRRHRGYGRRPPPGAGARRGPDSD